MLCCEPSIVLSTFKEHAHELVLKRQGFQIKPRSEAMELMMRPFQALCLVPRPLRAGVGEHDESPRLKLSEFSRQEFARFPIRLRILLQRRLALGQQIRQLLVRAGIVRIAIQSKAYRGKRPSMCINRHSRKCKGLVLVTEASAAARNRRSTQPRRNGDDSDKSAPRDADSQRHHRHIDLRHSVNERPESPARQGVPYAPSGGGKSLPNPFARRTLATFLADISVMAITKRETGAASPFVRITTRGGAIRAVISGPSLNERAAGIVSQELNNAIKANGRRTRAAVLDFASVTQMSSIGLGMCIDTRNTIHGLGGKTIVVNLSRELTDLFRMMKVDRLFTMALNEEEVINILRES